MLEVILVAIRSASVGCSILFFFQAEDGIRDYKVTGVQTCALPIYSGSGLIWALKELSVPQRGHLMLSCWKTPIASLRLQLAHLTSCMARPSGLDGEHRGSGRQGSATLSNAISLCWGHSVLCGGTPLCRT